MTPTFTPKASAGVEVSLPPGYRTLTNRGLNPFWTTNVHARGQAYRTAGWKTFDALPPYTPDQVRQDRGLYRRDAM
jgi:uncharacterized membrane protein